ncbi:hypothetical protein RHGRI_006198 [Rhododendron griersonianum]|uniref:Uncharacterized protein n=1 Tax=Rhododendron griersonianum TaxID=479676 RepID=A0AAV6KT76_9ERIC|nr:hypothetical protein RHGRI_006198 [Rhododendron griersonianum]
MGEEKSKSAAGSPVSVWPAVKPFVNGGAAGMLATCVVQPIDTIKVRIQLGEGSAVEVTKKIIRNEGIGGFYKGLSAGLLRQATYTTTRLGTFKILTKKAIAANGGKPLPLYQKALCGLTAGAIGACVGTPADLALVRMQADATLPPSQRRNYKNVFHALYRIIADEGVLALWKGAGPTVVRAMALNMGMLASYDQSVEFFRDSLGWDETRAVVVCSSLEADNSTLLFAVHLAVQLPSLRVLPYMFHEGVELWIRSSLQPLGNLGWSLFLSNLEKQLNQRRLFFAKDWGGASAVSGFFASACSLPFDYIKTQIQKMQPDAEGKYPYTGSLDCAIKTLKSRGPLEFYKGFPVYCVRIAPHVMVCKGLHPTSRKLASTNMQVKPLLKLAPVFKQLKALSLLEGDDVN